MNNHTQEKIQNIIIIGGGTSGWMAAAYLSACLNHSVNITVIESPTINRIGVGEATVPTIQTEFFDRLGMPEEKWMRQVQGTFKLGIKYSNWRKSPEQGGDYFYHIFGEMPLIDEVPLTHVWIKKRLEENYQKPMIYSCFNSIGALDLKKSPKFYDGIRVQHYAYHFDALLVANMLKDWSIKDGVRHITDTLSYAEQDEQGNIQYVVNENGKKYSADLFIDCSGFGGFLIEKALKEPVVSFDESLLTDRAIAVNLPDDPEINGIRPYTSATAFKAGWLWEIPLFKRSGNGYVYSSHFCNEQEAERELYQFFGERIKTAELRPIKFQSRRRRHAWVNNCVSIGLASAFLEPLESTGIYFIYAALYQLVRNFPNKKIDPVLRDKFNQKVAFMVDDIKDFIIMHFKTAQREDTAFWRANKYETKIPDSLQIIFDQHKAGLPIKTSQQSDEFLYSSFASQFENFWTNTNYQSIMLGVDWLPENSMPLLNYRRDIMEKGNKLLAEIEKNSKGLAEKLPSHYDYLKWLYQQAPQKNKTEMEIAR